MSEANPRIHCRYKETFAVDAALLEELGQRLIGRAPIALAELIKNAYDADATTCRIEFSKDEIVISDDGIGMSKDDFLRHWMRLGTTHKVDKRVSPNGRTYTGSKGIGRLSVQFLAHDMELETTSEDRQEGCLYAIVDWRNVVRGQDLDTVEVAWDELPDAPQYPHGSPTGTRITLKKLKTRWEAEELKGLGSEVWTLRSPFKRTTRRSKERRPEEFAIDVEAPDIEDVDQYFDQVRDALFNNWKARVRGRVERGRAGEKASITVEFRQRYPADTNIEARFTETVSLPVTREDAYPTCLIDKADFEILIFKPSGRQPGDITVGDLRGYLRKFGNVSVYDGGFRLPYYGSGQEDPSGHDWLSIAQDQGRRLSVSELLPQHLQTQNKYMQDLPAPGRIFGEVTISTSHERETAESLGDESNEWLQLQSGRDRLHDNQGFRQLRHLVRYALDYYANRHRMRALEATEQKRDRESTKAKYDRVIRILKQAKPDIPKAVYAELRNEIVDASKASAIQEENLDRRASLLAPLASAGMAALALNHELSREIRFLKETGVQLRQLAERYDLAELTELADAIDDGWKRFDSLQNLFAPLVTDEDREATDRLRVRAIVEQVIDAMSLLMPRVEFDFIQIPNNLRFPLGALAEWSALIQNILANAWNAMLKTPQAVIVFEGGSDKRGREWLHISDIGEGIDLPLSETAQLFEPFKRRLEIDEDQKSIAIGGQGLGLAIVRMIATRRSASVAFVTPLEPYSTTFEISWKGGKKK